MLHLQAICVRNPRMKKTYEKRALMKAGELTTHTAEPGPSNDV